MSESKKVAGLPSEFVDLQSFVDDGWALPTMEERYARRERATMEEIQLFYDTMLVRTEAILTYLQQFSLDGMPPGAKQLMYLVHSLATVSFSVEVWKQPRVWDSGAAVFTSLNEPLPV